MTVGTSPCMGPLFEQAEGHMSFCNNRRQWSSGIGTDGEGQEEKKVGDKILGFFHLSQLSCSGCFGWPLMRRLL